MSERIYCPVQTRSARLHGDPEPAEYCENEVSEFGDLCPAHDDDARMDDDYDRYLEEREDLR